MISTASFMTATCMIATKAETLDAANYGHAGVFVTNSTVIQCAIQATGANEEGLPTVELGTRLYNVFLPRGTTIRHTDKITGFGGVCELSSGDELELIAPPIDDGGEGAYLRCLCRCTTGRGAS